MTPAHARHTVVGFALFALLGVVLATLVEGWLPWSETASAASAPGDYSGLLTAPATAHAPKPPKPTSPCDANRQRQLVIVSIARQHLWACAGDRTVLTTPVTTGRRHGNGTPRGSFQVQARAANTTLRPADGNAVHVDYWLPFKEGIWGFHDAPWQTMPFGSQGYRTQGSLGCVHVPSRAMRQLFTWIDTGATVRIR